MPLCYKMLFLDFSYSQCFDIALHKVRQSFSDLCKDEITKQSWTLKTWEYTWRNSHTEHPSLLGLPPGFCDWYRHKHFCLSYCNTGISLKLAGEQESVIARWDAWSSLEADSASSLNLFGQEVLRPKFHTNSTWTWNLGIAPTLPYYVSGRSRTLGSMGHSRDTFGSLDLCRQVTYSLGNWKSSGGGQKSPYITQLGFQPGTLPEERAAAYQKPEVTRPRTRQGIRSGPNTPISEHQALASQHPKELHWRHEPLTGMGVLGCSCQLE